MYEYAHGIHNHSRTFIIHACYLCVKCVCARVCVPVSVGALALFISAIQIGHAVHAKCKTLPNLCTIFHNILNFEFNYAKSFLRFLNFNFLSLHSLSQVPLSCSSLLRAFCGCLVITGGSSPKWVTLTIWVYIFLLLSHTHMNKNTNMHAQTLIQTRANTQDIHTPTFLRFSLSLRRVGWLLRWAYQRHTGNSHERVRAMLVLLPHHTAIGCVCVCFSFLSSLSCLGSCSSLPFSTPLQCLFTSFSLITSLFSLDFSSLLRRNLWRQNLYSHQRP